MGCGLIGFWFCPAHFQVDPSKRQRPGPKRVLEGYGDGGSGGAGRLGDVSWLEELPGESGPSLSAVRSLSEGPNSELAGGPCSSSKRMRF